MPKRPRMAVGGLVYHVLNRANARARLFEQDSDYHAFLVVLRQAHAWVPMRTLAYCIMPNHWHLVLWPREDGDLPEFMRWLTVTHTKRWQAHRQLTGTGHLYQGRYRSFPVETDTYFLRVCRYVERNPLRAKIVSRAEQWPWSSLRQRRTTAVPGAVPLASWPVERPPEWIHLVNEPLTEQELAAIRASAARGRPLGSRPWTEQTAEKLGLGHTLRPRGRPRKKP